jgi:hypothetical protein
MPKTHLVLLLSVVAILPALWPQARAQGPVNPQVLYARQRQIEIPFDTDPAETHRLKQLTLHYSVDQGRTWRLGATAGPEKRRFNFLAEGDGLYLFAVQTTDNNGRNFPEKMDGVTPALRVVIDTVPPVVNLKAVPSRGNEVGVAWEVRDDNLDPNSADSIKLDYRVSGSATWTPLFRTPGASQYYWAPGNNALLEVRLKARDLAGNTTEAITQTSLANQAGFTNPGYSAGGFDPSPKANPQAPLIDANRKFLNTTRVSLSYEITERGPSGISGVDLWMTTDGRGWSKFQLPKTAFTDATRLTFDVQGEGVYGFTLIPKSGVGISAPAPQVGERPHIWVEVDLTKPIVELQSVLVGQGEYKGKLNISWSASDKNLGSNPITLSYSATNAGPWTPFATRIPNSGRYLWTMPPLGPDTWQFYLKVEAEDLAHNIGEAITPGLVRVDTLQPKAKIIDVLPGGQ